MTKTVYPPSDSWSPDISLVMPCFNEEDIVEYTVQQLVTAFENSGYNLELIAVDNGSWDRTSEVLKGLASKYKSVIYHRVDKNEGYGNGVLCGLPLCRGPWGGIIPADGQVDAQDVVRLYEAVVMAKRKVIGKVRRRFRLDGMRRKIISIVYNLFVRILWPRLRSIDINGSPKIFPREVIPALHLASKDWFLDPELMIKAHYIGLKVVEFNVFARMRGSGLSHVRMGTCTEFLFNLLKYRFSRELSKWREKNKSITCNHGSSVVQNSN